MDLAELSVAAPPPRTVTPIAIARILQRLSALRDGSSTPAGELRWAIELHRTLAFHEAIHLDAGEVIEISCDAELDRYTPEQARIIARFHADVSTAFQRERVGFASTDDVRAFLYAMYETSVADGACVLAIGDDEITVRELLVESEPWLSVSCLFMDAAAVSIDWLLAKSAQLSPIGLAQQGDVICLQAALPVDMLSAQRLVELIDDMLARRNELYRAYERDR